jgi:hypothetical protein
MKRVRTKTYFSLISLNQADIQGGIVLNNYWRHRIFFEQPSINKRVGVLWTRLGPLSTLAFL